MRFGAGIRLDLPGLPVGGLGQVHHDLPGLPV